MAKQKGGIFANVSGKVGNVVFATQRKIQTIRSVPSKYISNTPAQQSQREIFGIISMIASRMPEEIFSKFWKYYDTQNDPRNNFIKEMFALGVVPLTPDKMRVSRGKLEECKCPLKARYNAGNGRLELSQTPVVFRNGLLSDKLFVAVFQSDPWAHQWFFDKTKTRAEDVWSIYIPSGWEASDIQCYYTAYRGTNAAQEQSNSVWQETEDWI